VRILHTSDWHLGRAIRRQSRQPEFERVLADVVRIAREERVDVVLIAGDVYDSFAPPADAEKLAYETIGEIVRDGAQVVMIAGNHDSSSHMDAIAGLLRMVGVHCAGVAHTDPAQAVISVPSRDGSETAAIATLPWVPERRALQFETLFEGGEGVRTEYRKVLEAIIRQRIAALPNDAVRIFLGHILIDGSEIGPGGGERKLHIGHTFAVDASCFPDTASYVALGHVHKLQRLSAASPTFYSGSLLRLDFGEGGQTKYVNIVDVKANRPADPRAVEVTGGRGLRTISVDFDDLPSHAGKYGDDYLRVVVRAGRPVPALYEQVLQVLPHALDVTLERTDEPVAQPGGSTRGLSPQELLARYYQQKHNADMPEEMVALFNELYEAEAGHAPA